MSFRPAFLEKVDLTLTTMNLIFGFFLILSPIIIYVVDYDCLFTLAYLVDGIFIFFAVMYVHELNN